MLLCMLYTQYFSYHSSKLALDGIMTPKQITGGLKVKETNRTVYNAR